MASTFDAYDAALKKGLAKEVARAILPEGLTFTRLYMVRLSAVLDTLHRTANGPINPERNIET